MSWLTKFRFSWKFYTGIILIILSMIIGGVTKVLFFLHIDRPILRWVWVAAYFLSWPMLVWGAWWVGKEYTEKLRKYGSYKYYQDSLKNGTRRVYQYSKQKTEHFKTKAKENGQKFKDRTTVFRSKVSDKLKRMPKLRLKKQPKEE